MSTHRPDSIPQGFLADIVAHPDDDIPRLICADWLEEHGQEARAEFIRVQIELSRLPTERSGGLTHWSSDEAAADAVRADNPHIERLRRRERDLLDKNALAWGTTRCLWNSEIKRGQSVEDASNLVTRAFTGQGFRRGFVEKLTLPWTDFASHADALLAAHPVREVKITDWPSYEQNAPVNTFEPYPEFRVEGLKKWHEVPKGFPSGLGHTLLRAINEEYPRIKFSLPTGNEVR